MEVDLTRLWEWPTGVIVKIFEDHLGGNAAKRRPGLRTKTFIFDVNEYAHQNDVNTRRYNNQFFTAAKYGGYESDPANLGAKPYNTWGHPLSRMMEHSITTSGKSPLTQVRPAPTICK